MMVLVALRRWSQFVAEDLGAHPLAIPYCTICAPDVADSEVSSASSVSIKASTPVNISPHTLESCISPPVPCSAGPSSVLALVPTSDVKFCREGEASGLRREEQE